MVEKGYFDNMQVAILLNVNDGNHLRLNWPRFFQQRPDIAQMLTKGLVAAEFIGMDSLEMAAKRKKLKTTLNRKLSKKGDRLWMSWR